MVSGSRWLDNALFFNSIRVVDGVEVGSGFVKYYKELMNVIHEDRSWCFGNLRIFTFQPWPDHPESCAWVPKPYSRFSSNQAHSQQIQFCSWHQVCYYVSLPKARFPWLFISLQRRWRGWIFFFWQPRGLSFSLWFNKTWQNYINIRLNICINMKRLWIFNLVSVKLLWSVMNFSHIIPTYCICMLYNFSIKSMITTWYKTAVT